MQFAEDKLYMSYFKATVTPNNDCCSTSAWMLIHYKAMPRSVSSMFIYQCAPEGEKQHGVKFFNEKTSPCKARPGNSDFLM